MNSDMPFSPKKSAYNRFLKSLIGHQIVRACYYELNYSDPDDEDASPPFSAWDEASPDCHCLDFGLEVELETGKLVSFIWDYSAPYGVGIYQRPMSELCSGVMWDVTNHEKWHPFINKPIKEAKVYWTWWSSYPPPQLPNLRRYLPLSVDLGFDEGNRVFIGAYIFMGDDRLSPGGDEITIIFDAEVARRYRFGPYEGKFTPPDQGNSNR